MYFGQFLGLFWLGSSRFDTVTAFYDMFIVTLKTKNLVQRGLYFYDKKSDTTAELMTQPSQG